jgi:hypothetical protein
MGSRALLGRGCRQPHRLSGQGARNAVRAPHDEHFAALFVALGASGHPEQAPEQVVDGYWMGLAKRSIQLA